MSIQNPVQSSSLFKYQSALAMAKMPARWMIKRPLLWLKGLAFDTFRREYQVDGMTFSIPYDMTTRIFRARFMNDTYEKAERVCVSEFVTPGMRVLELGACLGVVSGMTNKALGFSHEHVVIEANPRLIPWLTNNLQNNNCKTSVEHGLLSRSSDGTFYLHNLIVGGSNVRETPLTTIVPVFNIEDLEKKYGFKFNVLIMDIEGGEQAIIDENKDWLRNIDLAIIEFHDFILGDAELMRLRAVLEDVGLARKQTQGSTEVWQRLAQ